MRCRSSKLSEMGADWELVNRFFWDGGSSFDAWLNIASSKIEKILVTIPFAWAQAGLPSALIAHVLHLLMGWWTGYMINLLYLKHRSLTRIQDNHAVQLHEVLGELVGHPWFKLAALFINIGLLSTISILELVSCSSIVFDMNNRLDKRTWTIIFGAINFFSILIPSAHNYRAWSFIGVVSTIYIGIYLIIVGISHETVKDVQMPLVPETTSEFFIGITKSIVLGTEVIHVEIMDAMWRPENYKYSWLYAMIYTAIISIFPTIGVFLRFGNKLLTQPNVISLLPKTVYRDTAIVLLLIHQLIVFGMITLPVYLIFEKMFKVHNTPKRVLVRIPVYLLIWLAALAFPFIGISSPIIISVFVTWGLYVLPCAAYVITFWKAASQRSHEPKPFKSMLSWEAIFSINIGVALWMITMSGLGFWANGKALLKKAEDIGLFTKCYNCKRA